VQSAAQPVPVALLGSGPTAEGTRAPAKKPEAAKVWTGKVLSVGDGDTYWISINDVPTKVRLADCDCPEVPHGKKPGQPFGDKAQAYAQKRLQGQEVEVRFRSFYVWGGGEIVAEVIVDGDSIGPEMLDKGLTWWYAAYSSNKALGMKQEQAKAFKRGLWSDPYAQAPWEFRRQLKQQAKDLAAAKAKRKAA
jgi:endonuclease YncB( thermonuclease family)